MLVRHFKMLDRSDSMLIRLLYVDINPVDKTSLLDDQIVEFLVNNGQLVNVLHQFVDLVILGGLSCLHLQHLLLDLEHSTLLLGQLDGSVVA